MRLSNIRSGNLRRAAVGSVGVLASVAVVPLVAFIAGAGSNDRAAPSAIAARSVPVVGEGGAALLDAERISLQTALAATPHGLGIPSVTGAEGPWKEIWIDDIPQVAFLWDSGLELYEVPLGGDLTEEEAVKSWSEKAAQGEDSASGQSHLLATIEGDPSIGHDKNAEGPSNLTWIHDELMLQLYSPNHSYDELREVARRMLYE